MAGSRQTSGITRVLKHRRPSLRARFIQPVVAKQGALFLLCTDTGDIQAGSDQGLYFHDMRYLSARTLRVNGMPLVSLLADASQGRRVVVELTNPDLPGDPGEVAVRKETLGVRLELGLGDDYTETLRVHNYVPEPAAFTLQLGFSADFADMFVVRGTPPGKRGTLSPPTWDGPDVRFQYDGADQHRRSLSLHFDPKPDASGAGEAAYRLQLEGQQTWELTITGRIRDEKGGPLEARPNAEDGSRHEDRERARGGALGPGTRVETDNPLFNEVLTRSFMDLHLLWMREKGQGFYAAGVPWYVALFGRDSLITATEVAAFEPEIGAHTLRLLAGLQGTKVDDWRDEQPGKILHELRVDEMANLDEIPQTPYYGSVDSTPLFLALLGIYSAWSGSLDLFHELHDHVEAALHWIDADGDTDGDGFIDYQTRSSQGARNQGWKDSGNGVVMEDGSLAQPPIALPEVQGDVYLAWTSLADLFERDGDAPAARKLRERAGRLYEAFNRLFWLDDEKYYAFCRQADGRFSKSIASNPAHALWTGIVDPQRADAVIARVLQPDLFSGWGIRTLAAGDASYNPVDYQVGSIWPHDNAIIVAGMQRYGYGEAASKIFTALMQAATQFEHFRLPETFAGYDRGDASRPVKYPVACNPQAWAAGSIPYMLAAMLGLEPDGFNHRLRIRHPRLPDWLHWVAVHNLRVGGASVDLRYERSGPGTLAAVTGRQGDLTVIIEP